MYAYVDEAIGEHAHEKAQHHVAQRRVLDGVHGECHVREATEVAPGDHEHERSWESFARLNHLHHRPGAVADVEPEHHEAADSNEQTPDRGVGQEAADERERSVRVELSQELMKNMSNPALTVISSHV